MPGMDEEDIGVRLSEGILTSECEKEGSKGLSQGCGDHAPC